MKIEKRQSQVGPKLLLHNPTTEVLLCRGAIACAILSLEMSPHPMLSPTTQMWYEAVFPYFL